MSAKKRKIWIVAAGTGGHIFPGLAIAREFRRGNPDAAILFFGTRDRLEARLIPEAGFPIHFLAAGQWKGAGIFGRLIGVAQIFLGFLQVVGLLLKGRPDLLISVGGYVSVPTAAACLLFRVPFFVVEPNIRSGLANRKLSGFAKLAFSAPGGDASKALKCRVVESGNPVREGLSRAEIRAQVKRVLVFGGSQGAKALCDASLRAARDLDFAGHGIELYVQTGAKNFDYVVERAQEMGISASVTLRAFVNDVPELLASTDLVLARAGAMTVAELALVGLPTVFVPFPFAADDHQKINAEILERAGAAVLVDERETDFQNKLERSVKALALEAGHQSKRQALSEGFLAFARPDAAKTIVDRIDQETERG